MSGIIFLNPKHANPKTRKIRKYLGRGPRYRKIPPSLMRDAYRGYREHMEAIGIKPIEDQPGTIWGVPILN